jgi:hypothetical protein
MAATARDKTMEHASNLMVRPNPRFPQQYAVCIRQLERDNLFVPDTAPWPEQFPEPKTCHEP